MKWPVSLAVSLLAVLDNSDLAHASTVGASVWTSQRKQMFKYVFDSIGKPVRDVVQKCHPRSMVSWF